MADVKELSINNTTYDIKAKSVVNQNSGSLKLWTGTKAEYDAIVTKDANTLYNVEDTTSPIISILDSLYPVGSIYIGTMSACPLQTLGVGTWQLVATDRVLQGAGTRGSVGNTLNESLPNIKGGFLAYTYSGGSASGVFTSFVSNPNQLTAGSTSNVNYDQFTFDASTYSSTYQDNAPVQQDAYLVNIWERIS